MKTNPFEDLDNAFTPFFMDVLEISGIRKNNVKFKTSCNACTFPPEKVDPFNDTQSESDLMQISIQIRKSDWEMNFKPQSGDNIRLSDDTKWSISEFNETQDLFQIVARGE